MTEVLAFGESPLSLIPPAQRLLAGRGPVGRMERVGARADELIYELIEERRADGDDGEDVLSMLLGARDEDGEPMDAAELRDELVTALVAGHETTASQLAWALGAHRARADVQRRLHGRARRRARRRRLPDGHDQRDPAPAAGRAQRRAREPRLVKQPIEIGGIEYQPGVVLFASAYLVHHDPAIYPTRTRSAPSASSRVARHLHVDPFGGGRRRCLGASFALLEMKIVLRAVLERCELHSAGGPPETTRRRGITFSPSGGSRVVLTARDDPPPRAAGRRRRAQSVAALA